MGYLDGETANEFGNQAKLDLQNAPNAALNNESVFHQRYKWTKTLFREKNVNLISFAYLWERMKREKKKRDVGGDSAWLKIPYHILWFSNFHSFRISSHIVPWLNDSRTKANRL